MDPKQPRDAIAAGTVDFMIESLFAKRFHVQPQPSMETSYQRNESTQIARRIILRTVCVRRLSEKLTQILARIMLICYTYLHHASIVNVTLQFTEKLETNVENHRIMPGIGWICG